jgi:hypothetical protein
MIVFSVTKVSNFLKKPRISAFHHEMFHGRAERGGREYPHELHFWANTEAPEPLKISRTMRGVPNVSCPTSAHFIVCERLAEQLQNIPHIRLMPVVFNRVVDIPYSKGGHSWMEDYGDHDPKHYLRTMPDVSQFHDIGQYFEVQTWRLADVIDRYEDAVAIDLETGTPPTAKTATVTVSETALRDYPMVYGSFTGSVFLAEHVFALLDAEIDRDFFIVRQFEVSSDSGEIPNP